MRGHTTWVAGLAALGLIAGGCAHRPAAAVTNSTRTGQNAKSPEMQRFQARYPGTAALMRSVTGVRIVLRSNTHPLTPEQARGLDAALRPLLTAPTLPQDKARQIAGQVSGNLTPDQQTDIGLLRSQFRGRRGSRRGGAGGGSAQAGSQGQADGRRMHWLREDMPANENIFRSGPAHQMLAGILGQLQTIEKT